MKPLRSLLGGLTLVTISLLILNCGEKSSTGPAPSQQAGMIGSVIVTAEEQQLYTIAGEEVTTLITATVTDTAGAAIPGILVHFTAPDFGAISTPEDSTDNDGKVTVSFSSQGIEGRATITAYVNTIGGGTVSGSTQIDILSLAGLPDDITLSLQPDLLYVVSGMDDSVKVIVRVMDSSNVGIPGLHVYLSTTLGVISYADTTNNSGTVVTYLHTNGEDGLGTVTASVFTMLPDTGSSTSGSPSGSPVWPGIDPGQILVPGIGLQKGSTPEMPRIIDDYVTISVTDTFWVFPIDANGFLMLFSNTDLIYADNGVTVANITALLKDAQNQVIRDAQIILTSDHGAINSPVLTDSTGQAHAIFIDMGIPSAPDTAKIIAKYEPLNIADTIYVMIDSSRFVDHIVLNSAGNTLTANYTDSTRVDATVYLEGNALAPVGTEVFFFLGGDNIGRYRTPLVSVSNAGTATVYYIAGLSTGTDTLYAEVDGIPSNPVAMQLRAGTPAYVTVAVDTNYVWAYSTETVEVTATVIDTTLNPVENGVGVLFTTTLGSVSPEYAQTIDGVATSFLSPSTNAGPAWVKATVGMIMDSTMVTILPSVPSTIGLGAQSTTIQVAGTGGNYQTEIYAEVRDFQGNPVGNDTTVYFRIENDGFPGGGVNLNNNPGDTASAKTIGGIATVALNAGINSGPVTIRAWTYIDEADSIWAVGSLVSIVSGPPDHIDVQLPNNNIRTGGGDVWQVEASALVWDYWGNQVVDGTVIQFYIEPDTSAEIYGNAFTGNENWDEESYPGIAFTTLSYHSPHTNDSVSVYAYCMVLGDSIIGSSAYLLPLSDGNLQMTVVPSDWNFDFPPAGYMVMDPAEMECRAYLTDGHGVPINGSRIVFHSTRGLFYWYMGAQVQCYEKITGPEGLSPLEPWDSTGYAIIYLWTTFGAAFPNPDAIENTAQVYCEVDPYFEVSSDQETVTFTHSAH